MTRLKRIQLENRTDLKSEIPLESPYVLFIDPSSACNFKCNFCMNSHIEKHEIMKWSLYEQIIYDLHEFKTAIKVIRLYGFGEPLLNPDFCKMVAYTKRSDTVLSVDTTTNASMLNPKLSEDLIKSGIDRINISIEGVTSKQYQDFTGRSINFTELVENIKYLHSVKGNTTIFIKTNGDYLSEDDKKKFTDIFTPISDGCDIEHVMSCWYDVDVPNENTEVGVYGQPREDVQVCPYIFYSFMIHADGKASVCFLDWKKRMLIGDARTQTAKRIWNSPDLKAYQTEMLRGVKTDICAKCDQLKAGMPVNLDAHAGEILRRL